MTEKKVGIIKLLFTPPMRNYFLVFSILGMLVAAPLISFAAPIPADVTTQLSVVLGKARVQINGMFTQFSTDRLSLSILTGQLAMMRGKLAAVPAGNDAALQAVVNEASPLVSGSAQVVTAMQVRWQNNLVYLSDLTAKLAALTNLIIQYRAL